MTAAVGPPRNAALSAVRLGLLTLLTGSAALARAEPPATPSAAERLRADELARQGAALAAKRGDSVRAAGLLLRSHRWDPSRNAERRRAISLLARHDKPAALRNARRALAEDPLFGADDPALLTRLESAAVERSEWGVAAELAIRRRDVLSRQVGLKPDRRASLERQIGRAYRLAGEDGAASDAFTRMMNFVAPHEVSVKADAREAPWAKEFTLASTWENVASCHLAAGRPERAPLAIERLAQAGGGDVVVEALWARWQLARGEPLAALEHAERAIDAEQASMATAAASYALLTAALRASNQSGRAVDELRRVSERRPDDTALSLALVETLSESGRPDEAWEESGRLVGRLLGVVQPVDPLAGDLPDDDPSGALRTELIEAGRQRLLLAKTQRRADALGELLPRLTDRLGSLRLLGDAVEEVYEDPAPRRQAAAWLADSEQELASAERPPGLRRAASHVALASGRPGMTPTFLRPRIASGHSDPTTREAALDELVAWVDELLNSGSPKVASETAEWGIALSEESASPAHALLHAMLAESLLRMGSSDDKTTSPPVDPRVVEHLEAAQAIDPENPEIAYRWVVAASRLGKPDVAIGAADSFLIRFDTPDVWNRDPAAEALLRPARLIAAGLLLEGAESERGVERLERTLDRWPDEPTALAMLALHGASRDGWRGRSRRMAERACRVAPDRPASWHALGRVQSMSGDHVAAERCLRRALGLLDAQGESEGVGGAVGEPDTLRAHYVQSLRALGRAEEAGSFAP